MRLPNAFILARVVHTRVCARAHSFDTFVNTATIFVV